MKPYPSGVRVVEVGPRDGLQNEPVSLPPHIRAALIEELADAGVSAIECGSFVSPKRVPQMADTEEVFAKLRRREGVCYSALVPNQRGLERALESGVNEVAVFIAASEEFSHANLNCSVTESLQIAQHVLLLAERCGIRVRGYLSCVWGSPFSDKVENVRVADLAASLYAMGCSEVSFGDTIGVGTPDKVRELLQAVASRIPVSAIAVHFHDTWGQALANVLASLEAGVTVIDSSVSGLGGCPYAPGATGNLATEDLLCMLHGMNIQTGIDLAKLAAAGRRVSSLLGRKSTSKAAVALESRLYSENKCFGTNLLG